MGVTLYDAAGEDLDFAFFNGDPLILTSGSTFRSNARCSVSFTRGAYALWYWQQNNLSLTSGWCTGRVSCSNGSGDPVSPLWGLIDATGYLRVFIQATTGSAPNSPFGVYTKNAAGTTTLLFTTSSGFSSAPGTPDKLDVSWNISTGMSIYVNKNLVGTYSGSLATDSITHFSGNYFGSFETYTESASWSEIAIANGNLMDYTQTTNAANGAGTLDQWTGSYTNINQITYNDANFDTTSTSGYVQRYAMPSIPVLSASIIGKVTKIRATQGTSSLAHIAVAQKINGGSYTSASLSLPAAFGLVGLVELVNPATGVAFTYSDLNTSRELGYEALT